MVFGLIAGVFSLLTSSVAYIIGAVIFSESTEMVVAFLSALVFIHVIIFIARALFSDRKHNVNKIMNSMRIKGHFRKLFASKYSNAMERKIISGGVARIIAFGTVLYMSTQTMFFAYAAIVIAAVTGVILVIAHRHKFSDLSWGVAIGLVSGFVAMKVIFLIMGTFGI